MATLQGLVSPRVSTVLEALTKAWGGGDVGMLDDVFAPTFIRRGQTSKWSREELKDLIVDIRRAFPDLVMDVTRVVESDDELALFWTSTGTLSDTYLGLPSTGRKYSVSGATFSRFVGDQIVEELVVYDRRGEYSSLGVPLAAAGRAGARMTDVDGDSLRALHRKLVTGVTVVTTAGVDGEPRGLAVNAFASVSLEPPLVLICIQKNSSTYSHLVASKYFGVNVLSADQLGTARVFATKQDRKFDQVAWHVGDLGVPLLDGSCAAMEIELQDTLHASTHTIFIGRVVGIATEDQPPLVYTGGEFFDGGALKPVVEVPVAQVDGV